MEQTKPSLGAIRAAKQIDIAAVTWTRKKLAEMIDRETKAPELLTMLEELLSSIKHIAPGPQHECIAKAESIIAIAKGESR